MHVPVSLRALPPPRCICSCMHIGRAMQVTYRPATVKLDGSPRRMALVQVGVSSRTAHMCALAESMLPHLVHCR